MSTHEHLEHLKAIRSMMEKSARFISLSGLSGVFAGITALVGAYLAHEAMQYWNIHQLRSTQIGSGNFLAVPIDFLMFCIFDALGVLVLSIGGGIYFTVRKSRKTGQKIWDETARRLLINLAIPLFTGGLFCLGLIYHHAIWLVAPATLIFYGLALINGSKYTLNDVRYLGLSEIALGIVALFLPGYGLYVWALGFGVLHIVYGIVMYRKYETH